MGVSKDAPRGPRDASPVARFHCVRFAYRCARNGTSGYLSLVLRDESFGPSSATASPLVQKHQGKNLLVLESLVKYIIFLALTAAGRA